jgi:hypothetical protein
MVKRIISVLGILLALSAVTYAEETYTVSGEVIFPDGEVIFISLYTFERFKNYMNKPLPPPPFSQIIELSAEQKKAGRVVFQFTGVPEGTYAILAFRDKIINRKLDHDRLEYFREPLSYYKVTGFSANWDEIKFKVDRDIMGIKIKF